MKKNTNQIDNRSKFIKDLIDRLGYDAAEWKRKQAKDVNHKYLRA